VNSQKTPTKAVDIHYFFMFIFCKFLLLGVGFEFQQLVWALTVGTEWLLLAVVDGTTPPQDQEQESTENYHDHSHYLVIL
jgi:hypothetical protein